MIQLLDSFFGECTNDGCEDYKYPEKYFTDEVKKDSRGEWVTCRSCGNRIYLDE